MPLEYVTSQRGNNLLVHNGYVYNQDKKHGEKIFWRCNDKSNCRGRVHTVKDVVTKFEEHNHEPDTSKIVIRKINSIMKAKNASTVLTTQNKLGDTSSRLSSVERRKIPKQTCLRRMNQKVKKTVKTTPPNPWSYEFEIPEQFKKTFNREKFLLFDSGNSGTYENRILIFSTRKSLTVLSNSQHWYSDGTFLYCPHLFNQFYTIHVVYGCEIIPLVYVLLPDKKEITYIKLFQILKSLKSNLCPKSFTVDFEKAAMNAISITFPSTKVHGCYFHFIQGIGRQLQIFGFSNKYAEDVEFASQVRQLGDLAFLPTKKVSASFKTLLESEYFTENEEMLSPIIKYFKSTWVGSSDRVRGHRDPLFSIELWNCFGHFEVDLQRTNNNVERWRNSFLALINCKKPTIWKFIDAIKTDHRMTQLIFNRIFTS